MDYLSHIVNENNWQTDNRLKTKHSLDRIAVLQEGQGLAAFCRSIGLNYERMRKHFQRRTIPDSDSLAKIAKHFHADLNWLISGKRNASKLNSRVGKNIKQFRMNVDWSIQDLADKLSIPIITLEHFEKGTWTIPLEQVQSLARKLGVPPQSFLEEEPMQAAQPPQLKVYQAASAAVSPKIRNDDYISIPLTDSAIAAGQPIIQENNIEDYVLLHVRAAGKRKNLVASRVDGDSMEPMLHSGDIVVIDRGEKKLVKNKIYAIFYEEGLTAKYVERQKDLLVLRPINPTAQVQIINLNENPDPIVGRVIGAWKEL